MPDYSGEAMARRRQAVIDGRFEYAGPHSTKMRCTVCTEQTPSSYGYSGGAWMDRHLGDHAPCPVCGKVRPVTMMRWHMSGRWHRGVRIGCDTPSSTVDSTGC